MRQRKGERGGEKKGGSLSSLSSLAGKGERKKKKEMKPVSPGGDGKGRGWFTDRPSLGGGRRGGKS